MFNDRRKPTDVFLCVSENGHCKYNRSQAADGAFGSQNYCFAIHSGAQTISSQFRTSADTSGPTSSRVRAW